MYCWKDSTGAVKRYSPFFIEFMKRLKLKDIFSQLGDYTNKLNDTVLAISYCKEGSDVTRRFIFL